jgi:putative FmdB family regulatory protein
MSPIYTYRCTKCGHTQEELASVTGGLVPWIKCGFCGAKNLRKVPSVPSDPQGGDTPKFYGGK